MLWRLVLSLSTIVPVTVLYLVWVFQPFTTKAGTGPGAIRAALTSPVFMALTVGVMALTFVALTAYGHAR